jgi:hypothetical protein
MPFLGDSAFRVDRASGGVYPRRQTANPAGINPAARQTSKAPYPAARRTSKAPYPAARRSSSNWFSLL